MPSYVILFRLPLNPGTKITASLREMGWESLSSLVYFRNVDMEAGEVSGFIRSVCGAIPELTTARAGMKSAFSVFALKQSAPVHRSA